jgi:hypothetical protein
MSSHWEHKGQNREPVTDDDSILLNDNDDILLD